MYPFFRIDLEFSNSRSSKSVEAMELEISHLRGTGDHGPAEAEIESWKCEEDKVKFLEALVTHQASLVEDMQTELSRVHKHFAEVLSTRDDQDVDDKDKYESYGQGQGINSFASIEGLKDSNFQDCCSTNCNSNLERRDATIGNLLEQLSIGDRSKMLLKSLYKTALELVETLEQSKLEGERGLTTVSRKVGTLGTDFLQKWGALQAFAQSQSMKIAKLTRDSGSYRETIMNLRLEMETIAKEVESGRKIEIGMVKQSYSKEIEHYRLTLKRLKAEQRFAWEKRLQAEKESWEYEKRVQLQNVKLKVEQLLIENEMRNCKETELLNLVDRLRIELNREKFARLSSELVESAESQVNRLERSGPKEEKRSLKITKGMQTDWEYISPEQLQHVRISKEQLETECSSLKEKVEMAQKEFMEKALRFQVRIQELQESNSRLHFQLIATASFPKRESPEQELQKNGKRRIETGKTMLESEQNLENKVQVPLSIPTMSQEHVPDLCNRIIIENLERQTFQIEIELLQKEKVKLLEIVEKERMIAGRWKQEFKELAKKSLMRS